MLDTPQVDDVILWLGAVIGALVVITSGLVALHRVVFGPVRKDIDSIRKELHRNGGASLRDAVDRIEERQQDIQTDVRRTAERLDDHIQWHLEDKP
jgi:hypothetical protein